MSLESRMAKLERVEGGDAVYAFQLHENQDLIPWVALCGDVHAEHPMSIAEFERRYGARGHIIQIRYVDVEDWNVPE